MERLKKKKKNIVTQDLAQQLEKAQGLREGPAVDVFGYQSLYISGWYINVYDI